MGTLRTSRTDLDALSAVFDHVRVPPLDAQPDTSVPRTALLRYLADRIVEIGAVRVGVDGVDGAGKTVFADALADVLQAAGREAVPVSVDGFHQPRALRYQRGRLSPEGFWLDSYDYTRLRADVLEPAASGGSRTYRSAIRDVASDTPVDVEPVTAGPGAVLVVDGIFLHPR